MKITKKKKQIAIWGWWQGENLGDQWIKNIMNDLFPDAVFINTEASLRHYGFIVCGGGGLFISRVPKRWKRISKKTCYGMIGLGAEFEHPDFTARNLAQNAKFFFVRDKYSMNCMHLENTARSYDITFAKPLNIIDKEQINLDSCFFVWRAPNKYMLSDPQFIKYQQAEYDYDDWENTITRHFTNVKFDDFITYESNIEERVRGCGFIISGRYHGIIAAIHLGIPCIGIDLCPKIRALMQEVGIEEYCLKLNEADKLENLIVKAKKNLTSIRQKELAFRQNACEVMTQQTILAQSAVRKELSQNGCRFTHF